MLKDRRGAGPYLIAEVGQNHNGSLSMAEELVRMAADSRTVEVSESSSSPGPRMMASAVKFTKRKLTEELSREAAEAEYGGQSFGRTYGEHRRALEFAWDEFARLSDVAFLHGIDFGVTVCHPDLVSKALERCTALAFLKVASRDIRNGPLLEALAEVDPGIPIVVSLGMAEESDLERVLRVFEKKLRSLTVLHCRSVYPAHAHTWDLGVIPALRARLSPLGVQVGYSDHSIGNAAALAAVAMGAEVIEKHVTLDRMLHGSDHAGSLDRGGLYRLVRDLERVHQGIGTDFTVRTRPEARPARTKLSRSLAWRTTLLPGTVVEPDHVCLVSPGTGLEWPERDAIVGKTLTVQVDRLTLCEPDQVE